MTINPQDPFTPALDEFERYYTEKIWDWIPPIYRDEDGLADNRDVLRSLVSIIAQQAAIARRSIDRLWEDQFIELCDDWAIPYLGDLVGTRLVHELNRRGRRKDVACTVFYRRRNGTPLVLERLTQDITGWEGTIVESFKRLGRTYHNRDPELAARLDDRIPISIMTPPGGWANLKSTTQTQKIDTPFDGFAHTPDFRRLRGHLGRYNIPKLNFHLYRLIAFPVELATPAHFEAGRFTFDPSGRDIPLFRPDQRVGVEDWRSPQEWEFPAPISCRLLGDARYFISTDVIDQLTIPVNSPLTEADLFPLVGILFRNEVRLRQTLESLLDINLTPQQRADFENVFDQILAGAIADSSPKAYLIPSPWQFDPTAVSIAEDTDLTDTSVNLERIPHQKIVAANLADWGASFVDSNGELSRLSPEKRVVIDPERGRFWFPFSPDEDPINPESVWLPIYHYGLAGNVGAGTYERRNFLEANLSPISAENSENTPGSIIWAVPALIEEEGFEFTDSKTYEPSDNVVLGIDCVTLQSANFKRPYIRRSETDVTEWVFTSSDDADGIPHPRSLILDGLWIGIQPDNLTFSADCPPIPATLVLEGTFEKVIIRHCTLDPGGKTAEIEGECRSIPYVRLIIRGGTVEELIIESSIVGSILEDKTPDSTGNITKLTVKDSIIHSIEPDASPAIETRLGVVNLQRVTVFGNVLVKELNASEAIIQGRVSVTDNQHGCFRFSATNDEPETRLPPQFESHLFAPAIPNLFFVSRRFGDPGYAQLSRLAPVSIVRGAENRSEMGVFSRLLNPIKQDDLNAKVNEFMPFGLIAQFIRET